jgi:hypothetical protein
LRGRNWRGIVAMRGGVRAKKVTRERRVRRGNRKKREKKRRSGRSRG